MVLSINYITLFVAVLLIISHIKKAVMSSL